MRLRDNDWVKPLADPQEDYDFKSKLAFKFTVRTMFVLLTVTAVSAACLGGFLNAANKQMQDVVLFIPLTAAAPLALMVLINYLLKLGDWWVGKNRRKLNPDDRERF